MKYLLDTHAIILYFDASPNLSKKAEVLFDDNAVNMSICSISLWEIAIKMNLGKLKVTFTLDELLNDILIRDFDIIQIKDDYLKRLSSLPYIHKDPFDRLLIATALVENLTIITADENIQKYDVSFVW